MATYNVNLTATSLDGEMGDPEVKVLNKHIQNSNIHVTVGDKESWDAKADQSAFALVSDKVAINSADMIGIIARLGQLEDRVIELSQTDRVEISDLTTATDVTKDVVINTVDPVLSPTPVTGKSITVNKLTVVASGAKSAMLTATADAGDVNLKNIDLSGDMSTTNDTVQLIVESDEYCRITDSIITASGYNAINIGDKKAPKSVVIDNVQFLGEYRNNTISIYGTKDNAIVTISNCVFRKSSNPLRIFNETNTKLVVNLINCKFEEWESTTPEYAGPILCEDAFTKGEFTKAELATAEGKAAAIAKEKEYNRYSPGKVVINMINCTHNGKPIVFENLADVAGTKNVDTQLIYVYNHVEGFVEFDETRYPKFTAR